MEQKLNKELLGFLRLLKNEEIIDQETAIGIALILNTEQKAETWMDWVLEHIENPQVTQEDLLLKATIIASN